MKMFTLFVLLFSHTVSASPLQLPNTRSISGVVVTQKNELVREVTVIAKTPTWEIRTLTNDDGKFSLEVPDEKVRLRVEGPYLAPHEESIEVGAPSEDLRIEIVFQIPPIHQSIVITASGLDPQVQTYSDEVYKKTLFSRDDQLFETLNGGINAGQHEGGGKSLEIRRFGFNLDHGGVNGGLKVLVD